MQIPLQITFQNIPHSAALEVAIRERAAKLDEFYPRLMSCHVVVEENRRHQRQGQLFNMRIDMRVPGKELVVNRNSDEDAFTALREAFDAAKRILEDEIRLQRQDVKHHELAVQGQITHLDAEQRSGLIETDEIDSRPGAR